VAQGVVEQVGQHLTEPVTIGGHDGVVGAVGDLDVQGDAGVGVPGGGLGVGVGHDLGDPQGGAAHGEPALFGGGDQGDVLPEPGQAGDLGAQQAHDVGVGVADAVLDGLQVGVERGEGSAHLVGEIAEHAPAAGLDRAKVGGHRVERVAQFLELRAHADRGDPGGVVAGRDPVGGVGGHFQGPAHPAGEGQAHHRGRCHRGHEGHGEGDGRSGAEGFLGVHQGGGVAGPGVQQMVVEDPGSDRGGDHPGGGRRDEDDGGGRGEQAGRQPPPLRAGESHVPVPMRYPTPRTVRTNRGSVGSSPSLRRRCPMWTSTRCSSPTQPGPQTASMSWRRV